MSIIYTGTGFAGQLLAFSKGSLQTDIKRLGFGHSVSYMNMYAAAPTAKTRLAPICRGAAPLSELPVDWEPLDSVPEAKPVCADPLPPELVVEAAVEVAEPVGPVLVVLP